MTRRLLRPFLLEEAECRHMKFWQTGDVELTGRRLASKAPECRLNDEDKDKEKESELAGGPTDNSEKRSPKL